MENQASTKSFIINNGVILGVLGVLISVINYAFGTHLDPHWSTSLASGIFFIGLIILGISQFKKAIILFCFQNSTLGCIPCGLQIQKNQLLKQPKIRFARGPA